MRDTPCNRREFIGRTAGLTLAGTAFGPLASGCGDDSDRGTAKKPPPGRVVRLERPGLLDERGRICAAAEGEQGAAGAVLEEILSALLDKPSLKDALGALFEPDERVGIKLNCLAGRGLSPQPPLVHALIDGLIAAGIKAENIVVFERSERELREAGFSVSRKKGPLFVGNDTMGYERTPRLHRSIGSCFSRIVVDEIDALINFGVLKDHNLAGISAGLKNLYGLIHNPNKYHDRNCNPYVADIADCVPVRDLLRLTLCDGFVSQYHGGPALMPRFTWKAGIFLASRDPVALDATAWEIIDKKRKEKGLPSLAEDKRAPLWIETAASYGLGEARSSEIELVEI